MRQQGAEAAPRSAGDLSRQRQSAQLIATDEHICFPAGRCDAAGSMVTTWHKAVSSASPGLLAPGITNAATQTELLSKHATTQVSGCGMCAGTFLDVESDSQQACGRSDQID